jgi:hypothetical protein
MSNTPAPEWNDEEWIIRNIPYNAKLTVKLYDKEDGTLTDDYIGQFLIENLINYNPPLEGHKIVGALGQDNGRFHLSIRSMKSSEDSKQLPPYTFDGPCRYFRHNSVSMGRLTMVNTDCIYSTWKIPMRRLSFFFPPDGRQHWNRKHTAARAIFGDCALSYASRSTFKLAHKVLYGRTLKHNEHGRLDNADDVWKHIFYDKIAKRMKPCIYTYVIDDNTWRFSEAGNQFFTDFASKHVLLANCSEHVRYAGEFHLRPKYGWDKRDDEWELVFDNESGTYAPKADLLVNLKELLLFNFPGLNIVTFDYRDPKLKESIELVKIAIKNYKNITPTIDQLISHYRPIISNKCDNVCA